MRRGAPERQHDGDDVGRIELGGLGGSELAGHQHADGGGPPARDAEQHAQHLVADRADVGRPGLQVGVGEGGELGARPRRSPPPTPARRPARRRCARPRRQQVGVVEQQQVGVEDRRVGLPEIADRAVADLRDAVPDGGDRLLQPVPFDGRIAICAVRIGHVEVRHGATTGPVRRRCRGTRRADRRPAPGPGRRGAAGAAGSSNPRAASATRWSSASRAWAPAGPHLDLVAVQGAERGHPRQARRRAPTPSRWCGCAARSARRTAAPPAPPARPAGRAGRAG